MLVPLVTVPPGRTVMLVPLVTVPPGRTVMLVSLVTVPPGRTVILVSLVTVPPGRGVIGMATNCSLTPSFALLSVCCPCLAVPTLGRGIAAFPMAHYEKAGKVVV